MPAGLSFPHPDQIQQFENLPEPPHLPEDSRWQKIVWEFETHNGGRDCVLTARWRDNQLVRKFSTDESEWVKDYPSLRSWLIFQRDQAYIDVLTRIEDKVWK